MLLISVAGAALRGDWKEQSPHSSQRSFL